MAFVTLPNSHRDDDYTLAVEIASRLDLEELHVFHVDRPMPPPRVERHTSPPPAPRRGLLSSVGAMIDWLGNRLVPEPR
jgi:hypothetical protein